MNRLRLVTALALLAMACDKRDATRMKPPPPPPQTAPTTGVSVTTVPFKTFEEARAHVLATKITGSQFELPIANNATFAGHIDRTGAGMAVTLDAILAQGFGPDGFEQRDGYRLYRYKPLE
jgi:hypothetical protein